MDSTNQGRQARSKQCLIGPAIAKLSAGDLGAGHIGAQCTSPAPKCILNKKIVQSTKTVVTIGDYRRHELISGVQIRPGPDLRIINIISGINQ